jgi:hypothetical protein
MHAALGESPPSCGARAPAGTDEADEEVQSFPLEHVVGASAANTGPPLPSGDRGANHEFSSASVGMASEATDAAHTRRPASASHEHTAGVRAFPSMYGSGAEY